jgi:catechol 2,3-dioxygenase-like lactoylglutathione lyase family enzyme
MGSSFSLHGADQSTVRLDPRDPYLRIQAVNIFVRDQDRSLRFYLQQLGFDLVIDARLQSGQRWLAVAPPDGTTVLRLIAPDPRSQEYQLIGRSTQVVFLTEDVLAKFREWCKRGVRFRYTPRLKRIRFEQQAPVRRSSGLPMQLGQEPPLWGGVSTRFEDVDGNSFSLVGFDEASR